MVDIISDPIGAPPQPESVVQPHAVFLLDESGSMTGFRAEVVSTFNEYVNSVKGTAKTVSLYTFDTRGIREKIYKIPPERCKRLELKDYDPNAGTPLYDAMATVINKFKHETRPVQFFSHTDGHENASAEWTKASLDELIAVQTHAGWLFTYLMEGLRGREAMSAFQGLKMGFSPTNRVQAMHAAVSSTALYSQTMDNNAVNYTVDGTDNLDLDKGETLRKSTVGGLEEAANTTGGKA